jgi:hypothetical protein
VGDDTVLLDLRTVETEFDTTLVSLLRLATRVTISPNAHSFDHE